MLSWLLKCIELILDNTPVLGKLKSAVERDFPDRELSHREILQERWREQLASFVNAAFAGTPYDKKYTPEQLAEWLQTYSGVFIVIVRKKIVALPPFSEQIVGTAKILPLKEDVIGHPGFDPFSIRGHHLVDDERNAQAIWIGDLVSKDQRLLLLLVALRFKLERLGIPIYCRTANAQLRRILFERYGARVLNPTGANADAQTILVMSGELGPWRKPGLVTVG